MFIRNQFIVSPVNVEHRRFIPVHVGNWTSAAYQFGAVFAHGSKKGSSHGGFTGHVADAEQSDDTGHIAGVIKIFADIKGSGATGPSQHPRKMTPAPFPHDANAASPV